ncbi:uncharacterized protein LOC130665538 [Microplitis mediator]|uniref:uncharacterized protein LOC130665538 n=1 Tax=Microplitis mediator TaxID=375433 RepID=UPI002555C9B2|nr:uncharacterized protein LOC130665538 [Microplitis mediator]
MISQFVIKIQAKGYQDYNHPYYNRSYNFSLLKTYKVTPKAYQYVHQNNVITPRYEWYDCGVEMAYNETLIISGVLQNNVPATDYCFIIIKGEDNIRRFDGF